ncbi:MAG: hypothetical protein WA944_23600 [Mycobacterium sp.]
MIDVDPVDPPRASDRPLDAEQARALAEEAEAAEAMAAAARARARAIRLRREAEEPVDVDAPPAEVEPEAVDDTDAEHDTDTEGESTVAEDASAGRRPADAALAAADVEGFARRIGGRVHGGPAGGQRLHGLAPSSSG